MNRHILIAAIAALGLTATHAARAVEVIETVDVAAPPAKVWGIVGNFGSIGTWHPAAKSSPADHDNRIGSVRVITLKAPGDPTITEALLKYDPVNFSYGYTILSVDPKVLPVTNYRSTFAVKPAGGGSQIVWTGVFDAAGGADDTTASKAIAGVYRGGLDNIKALADKQ